MNVQITRFHIYVKPENKQILMYVKAEPWLKLPAASGQVSNS